MGIKFNKLLPGKLDNQFLGELLKQYTHQQGGELCVGAGIGQDAAAIDLGDYYLIAKTDPITFTSRHLGYYAVHINSNDIACMGGEPKWFLATLLLPEETATKKMAEDIFRDIFETCDKEHIRYIGGHTEITVGVKNPILVGHMLGLADKDHLIHKEAIKEGDRLIVIGQVPLEATSILARDKEKELEHEFGHEFVRRCQNFLFQPGISVLPAARLCRKVASIHALHDATEGGICTAIHELMSETGLGITVTAEDIPQLPEGKLLCDHYQLDPLGCISSGSLLALVSPADAKSLLRQLKAAGMIANEAGKVTKKGEPLVLVRDGKPLRLPYFPQDELIKIFD
ncbi:hydrogenase expression/formation protein [candidate division KSB1 bacterium]|nr:hydrogenase expression/formation protein [candidate division KSB1 bacterium]